MIRPLTIATFLLACGSGLYLYQSKHEVQLLDRTIERTVHDTNALREQSRLLAAEWTMLNDPERLRQFTDTYLSLRTITPSQFSSLGDLDTRLPAPLSEVQQHGADEQELAPQAVEMAAPGVPGVSPAAVAIEGLPTPPIPAMPSAAAVATVARAPEGRTLDRPPVLRPAADNQARSVAVVDARPSNQRLPDQRFADQHAPEQHAPEQHAPEQHASEQHVPEQRSPDQRLSDQHVAPRVADARVDIHAPVAALPRPVVLAAPRPLPANVPVTTPPVPSRTAIVASAPFTGSLLGMARSSMPPAPRPTPVSAMYNAN